MGPPSLHWLSTVWWCSGHSVVVPLSSIFVFFLSHAFSTVATQSSSHSAHASLLPVLILYGGWHGLVRLAPLLPLLRPMGLPTGTPIGLAHWALFPSFFLFVLLLPFASILPHFFLFLGLWDYLLHFLPGFYNPLCFCHCLLITFLHFSLLVIGPFLSKMGINTHFALAPFKFKQLQTIFYRCVCVYH